MSLADAIAANYERTLTQYGEWVEVSRTAGTTQQLSFRVPARARVRNYKYSPDELVGSVVQTDTRVKVLYADLIAGQFPLPVSTTDKIFVRGKEKTIIMVDNNTGRVGTTQIFVEIIAKG